MNTKLTTQKTLFREEVEEYQKEQKRTKSAGLQDGLLWAGVSAGSLLIIALVRIISGSFPEIVLLVVPVMVIGLVIGLYRIIISLVRSEKQVTCPKCGTVHEIFNKERLYMCTECWTLLYMGEDSKLPIQFLNCAYCGNKAAVTKDHGPFVCLIAGSSDLRQPKRVIGKPFLAPAVKRSYPRRHSIVSIAAKFSNRFPHMTRIGKQAKTRKAISILPGCY